MQRTHVGVLPSDSPSHGVILGVSEVHDDELDGGGDAALGAALHPIVFGGLVAALEHKTLFLCGNIGPELAVLITVTRFYAYSYS